MRLPTVPNVESADLRRFLIAVRENLKKLNELYFTEDEYKAATSGSEMAGRPVILNSDGLIDGSMIDDSDIDHGSISGLEDDDHTSYHTDSRADSWFATKTTDDLVEGSINQYHTPERAQDAVGTILDNGTTDHIVFTYDDSTPKISAQLKDGINVTTRKIVTNGRMNSGSLELKYREYTVVKGGLTAESAESDWTAAPLT